MEQDEGDNTIMVNRITAANREESKARQDLELAIAQVAEKKSRASEAESNQQSLIMKVVCALIWRSLSTWMVQYVHHSGLCADKSNSLCDPHKE